MYDVAIAHGRRALQLGRGVLDDAGLTDKGFVLVTAHRAENTDDPTRLAAIVDGLLEVAQTTRVVWPLHPRTRGVLERLGRLADVGAACTLLPPQGYLDMVRLETAAAVIATDSGGVQKEAFFHGVPCVTLRDETEWTELVDSGWNRLVPPTSARAVADGVRAAMGTRGRSVQPYGDGHAAGAIVDVLARGVPRG
jgi:UDP-GlcNAc3NAcA epimerase